MAHILNVSKGTVVAEDVAVAPSFWGRFRGLMVRREMASGEALVIAPSASTHTAFMRFPIGGPFLDRQKQVVKPAENVRPFRAAFSRGHYALELNEGSAGRANVAEGDRLLIVDQPGTDRIQDQSPATVSEKQETRVTHVATPLERGTI